MRGLRGSFDLHPAPVRTTFRCTQFPNNKSPDLEHVETGLHLVAVSAHAHVALHALRTFLPASSAVLSVALVDELAFSLAAYGSEVALLSPLTAMLVCAGLALALAAEASIAALLSTLPAVVAVVLQVGAPPVAARLSSLAAGFLGPALGFVHRRLVNWGLVAAHFLALAALAHGVLGAALATLAAVLVVAAQVHAPMVAATAILEPPVALAGRLAGLRAALRLRQHASGSDRSLISSNVGNICNFRLLCSCLICIERFGCLTGKRHRCCLLDCQCNLQEEHGTQQCQQQHTRFRHGVRRGVWTA